MTQTYTGNPQVVDYTELIWDFLLPLASIGPFKDDVNKLREKFGFPIVQHLSAICMHLWDRSPWFKLHCKSGHRSNAEARDEFNKEFEQLKNKIIMWMREEYKAEWKRAGAGIFFEDRPGNFIEQHTDSVLKLYSACVNIRQADRAEEERKKAEEERKKAEEARKKAEEERKKAEEAAFKEAFNQERTALIRKQCSLLAESLSMHYFPERVEDGIRKPAEWLPDFNTEVIKRLGIECRNFWLKFDPYKAELYGKSLAAKILQLATEECRPAYEKLLESYRKAEEEKRWKDEERKALIMARAMLQAQAEAAAIPPSAPPAPSTEDPT